MRRQHINRDPEGGARRAARLRSNPGSQGAGGDAAVAELASTQHGVVTRDQLVAIGLDPRAIDRRLEAGRLHRLHRGVYLVGHRAELEHTREMAAVLACGKGAVISHRSAAHLWALLPYRTRDAPPYPARALSPYPARADSPYPARADSAYPAQIDEIDITVPARNPGPKRGIRIHRVRHLDRRDVRTCRAIPVTTPARTLLDLAAQASSRELEQAVAEAERRGLVHRPGLSDLLARLPGRPGAPALGALLGDGAAPALTRSQAEERMLALIRAGELPPADVNARIGRFEVDFLWRNEGLVVEVDGFAFHSSRSAFERDRLRDADLGAQGYRVMRVTWRQIVDSPEATLARISAALAVSRAV